MVIGFFDWGRAASPRPPTAEWLQPGAVARDWMAGRQVAGTVKPRPYKVSVGARLDHARGYSGVWSVGDGEPHGGGIVKKRNEGVAAVRFFRPDPFTGCLRPFKPPDLPNPLRPQIMRLRMPFHITCDVAALWLDFHSSLSCRRQGSFH